jgi:cell filamentation protein
MSDETYCYPPDFVVLRNKLEIRDPRALDLEERRLVSSRIEEGTPSGDFDLLHLQAIHRHLFQDIFDWAGQLRTVDISKGDTGFMPRQYIETGMADVHRRIVESHYYQGLGRDSFAEVAGVVIGDVNYVHPFREGNGRTQVLYLQELAARAGHDLNILKLNAETWMPASAAASDCDYAPMATCIRAALG